MQDILVIINQCDKTLLNDKFKLGQNDDNLNDRFLAQINSNITQDEIDNKICEFFTNNIPLLNEIFDKILSI